MELRSYQSDCVNSVLDRWNEFNKVLTVLPTGTGKTIIMAHLADRIVQDGGRVLILAHRDELIRQASDKIMAAVGRDCSIEKAQEYGYGLNRIVVGSVQTLVNPKRQDVFGEKYFSHIFCDEAHHILADSYLKIFEYFNESKVLGVTATPDRGDKKNLGKFFDDLAYEYGLKQAIDDGFLCQIVAETVPVKIDMSNVYVRAGDFKDEDLDNAIDPYLEEIACQIKEKASDRKTLIFLPLIKTSQKLANILNDVGLRACHVDGKSPDRKEILIDFKNGKYNVLTNSNLLNEGYDEPSIDCVIVLRPTRSRSLYCQMTGRGTRLHEGKKDLLLLDFLWHSERHSLARPASLIAKDEELASKMTEMSSSGRHTLKELEEKAVISIKHEREKSLADQLKALSGRKSKVINPVTFAALIHDTEIQDYEPTWKWETTDATEKQREFLERYGLNPNNVTKGLASLIIGKAISRKGLASPKQMALLYRFGYRDFDDMTMEEASERIDRIARNGWSRDFRKRVY